MGRLSQMSILDDPWLPKSRTFLIPPYFVLLPHISKVQDLKLPDGIGWNVTMIQQIFPSNIAGIIAETPILDREVDQAIWCPSSSGFFTIKSTYDAIVRSRLLR